jgi:hypothetical protein
MTRRPYSPKEIVDPRHALPRLLPFCCLRNFTFFGINIAKTLNLSCQLSAFSFQSFTLLIPINYHQ